MECGSKYIENPAMLYLSGSSIGEILVAGSGFWVYWKEQKQ